MICSECGIDHLDPDRVAELEKRLKRLERLHGVSYVERPVSSQDAREQEEDV